jgi:hypothetical protein
MGSFSTVAKRLEARLVLTGTLFVYASTSALATARATLLDIFCLIYL